MLLVLLSLTPLCLFVLHTLFLLPPHSIIALLLAMLLVLAQTANSEGAAAEPPASTLHPSFLSHIVYTPIVTTTVPWRPCLSRWRCCWCSRKPQTVKGQLQSRLPLPCTHPFFHT